MKKYIISIAWFCVLCIISNTLYAQGTNLYSFEKKIALPGEDGYDYLFIDQNNARLYVSHGSTVHVIDLKTDNPIGAIDKMQGNHGIAIAPAAGKGFISDGKANAVVAFDINTLKTIATIPLSGKKPDAIIFDSFSNEVFAFNGSSDNASIIDINTLKETGTISLGGAPEFAVADSHGKIYNNLEDKNVIKVIDSKGRQVINSFALSPCGGPTGLAYDSVNKKLFTVCRENKGMSILDIVSGKVVATVPIGAGVDAVAYDMETKLIFCSNGDGTVTIIKQVSPEKYSVVQTLVTQPRAKTLALDTKTHKLYLSVSDLVAGTKDRVPGSFKVLVYKMN